MGDARKQELTPGQTVPGTPYQVIGLLGQGGMGRVYEVVHRVLGRHFVLKVLHGQLAQRADLVERMANEWRTLGALNHRNIVAVTDAGYTSDRIPYYVMEKLEGETLADLLRREGTLPVRRAAHYIAGVLDGLAAAHALGAIHRDIKPQNIFISGGDAKVLDFGVAKLTEGSRVVTAAGLTVGTPRYMSPEQAAGQPIDGRSDIYATGLVFYELLTGRSPFSHVKEPHELVLAHISEEPARVDWIVRSLPEHVGDLLHRWLAKVPDARPPTAAAALKELTSLVAGLTTEVTRVEDVTRAGAYEAETLGPAPVKAPGAPSVGPPPALLEVADAPSPSRGRPAKEERPEPTAFAPTIDAPPKKLERAGKSDRPHVRAARAEALLRETPAPVARMALPGRGNKSPWAMVMLLVTMAVAGGTSAWLLQGVLRGSFSSAVTPEEEALVDEDAEASAPVDEAPRPEAAPAAAASVSAQGPSDAQIDEKRGEDKAPEPEPSPMVSAPAQTASGAPAPRVQSKPSSAAPPATPTATSPSSTTTAAPRAPSPTVKTAADPLAIDPFAVEKKAAAKQESSKPKSTSMTSTTRSSGAALPSSGL